MEFIELNENRNTFSIRGHFTDEHFDHNGQYGQEIHLLKNMHKHTINNDREHDPDISYTLSFNHTDGHDGELPLMAKMRDWWSLNKKNSVTWLLTQDLGGTSTLHKDHTYDHTQYIIFCTKWEPGQWWWFDGETYTGWNIGTVIDFDFSKPHATANASWSPRTIMQIKEHNQDIFMRHHNPVSYRHLSTTDLVRVNCPIVM
tara:strand:+ start:2278 stop:2880 length:603 start_codon:yes stop_codon:yes gene_type:complete